MAVPTVGPAAVEEASSGLGIGIPIWPSREASAERWRGTVEDGRGGLLGWWNVGSR